MKVEQISFICRCLHAKVLMNIAFYTNYAYLDFFIESCAQSACVRCRSNEHEDILKKVILKLCGSLVPCVGENLLAAHIVLTLCV